MLVSGHTPRTGKSGPNSLKLFKAPVQRPWCFKPALHQSLSGPTRLPSAPFSPLCRRRSRGFRLNNASQGLSPRTYVALSETYRVAPIGRVGLAGGPVALRFARRAAAPRRPKARLALSAGLGQNDASQRENASTCVVLSESYSGLCRAPFPLGSDDFKPSGRRPIDSLCNYGLERRATRRPDREHCVPGLGWTCNWESIPIRRGSFSRGYFRIRWIRSPEMKGWGFQTGIVGGSQRGWIQRGRGCIRRRSWMLRD